MFEGSEPTLREAKPAWADVPNSAVRALEAWLGVTIADGTIAWGGYGPGASFILDLADGSRRFAKARHPDQTPEGNAMLTKEIAARRRYPFIAEVAPSFLGAVPAGDWEWLVFEYIVDAAGALPWSDTKLKALVEALGLIFTHSHGMPLARSDVFAEALPTTTGGWHAIGDDPATRSEFLAAFLDRDAAAAWLDRVLPRLRSLQAARLQMTGPTGLVHFDLRSDNLLFRPDGSAVLLDWSEACIGALALDLCGFAPSCIGEGGSTGDALRAGYENAIGKRIPDRDIAIALANIGGYFASRVGKPWRPNMPRLRWVVRQQLWGAMHWAETVLDLPPLPQLRTDNLTSA